MVRFEEPLFDHYTSLGDRFRDRLLWEAAYHQYRLALDISSRSPGYLVQIGHMAKEMGYFECAEAYYRSSVFLGFNQQEIEEHLLFVAKKSGFPETRGALAQLCRDVAFAEAGAKSPAIIDDILIIIAIFGLTRLYNISHIVQWMRDRHSISRIMRELSLSGSLNTLTPEWLNVESLGSVGVGGMPRWRASALQTSRWPKVLSGSWIGGGPSGLASTIEGGVKRIGHWMAPVMSRKRDPELAFALPELRADENGPEMDADVDVEVVPVLVELSYEQTVSPADLAEPNDTRRRAIQVQKIILRGRAEAPFEMDVDLTDPLIARRFIAFGFSPTEVSGTSSVGSRSGLIFWLPPNSIDLEIEIRGGPHGLAFQTVGISIETSSGFVGAGTLDEGFLSINLSQHAFTDAVSICSALVGQPSSKNVSLTKQTHPIVSIIILNFNKSQLSLLSAISAMHSETTCYFEVIIADNGSNTDELNILNSAELPFVFCDIAINRYFGEGNNIAAEFARGDFLLFLNNDAFLFRDTCTKLYEALKRAPDFAAIGPVFYYPDGQLQEAGALAHPDGYTLQRGKKDASYVLPFSTDVEAVDYVSAACVMFRRKDFFAVGGFNYRYDPVYYEDTDICFRLRVLGKLAGFLDSARCVHIEYATTSETTSAHEVYSVAEYNRSVFLSTWGHYLRHRTPDALPSKALLPAGSPRARQQNVFVQNAVYSPFPLVPGGGERYILSAAQVLSEFGETAYVSPALTVRYVSPAFYLT